MFAGGAEYLFPPPASSLLLSTCFPDSPAQQQKSKTLFKPYPGEALRTLFSSAEASAECHYGGCCQQRYAVYSWGLLRL